MGSFCWCPQTPGELEGPNCSPFHRLSNKNSEELSTFYSLHSFCEPFGGSYQVLSELCTPQFPAQYLETMCGEQHFLTLCKHCLTLGEPLNVPKSWFSPLLTGKSPFHHRFSLFGSQGQGQLHGHAIYAVQEGLMLGRAPAWFSPLLWPSLKS